MSKRAPNLPLPTLGGLQFWTDRRIRSGWRVQRHTLLGHHRLLDPRDVRRAWGTRETCLHALEQHAPPIDTAAPVVVILHGLGRTRWAMRRLNHALKNCGWQTINFGYASTRSNLADFAEALDDVLTDYRHCPEIHFVGHSMGNLVVRYWLGTTSRPDSRPNVGRTVMLAPPNQGSILARRLSAIPGLRTGMGPAASQIIDWDATLPHLATPPDFGIIAGRFGLVENPLLDDAGDFIVTRDECRLDGCAAFAEVDSSHTFIMYDDRVAEMVDSFLRNGRLAPDERAG